MPCFEVLTGLPPYGPPAEPFSATGGGTHREGFVVRFTDSRGRQWVGNFQPGFGGLSEAFEHPDGRRVVVIARGQGYTIDPDDRAYRAYFGGTVDVILPVPDLGFILGNGLSFEAIGPGGTLWKSDRISWDGMRGLSIGGQTLTGESWDPLLNQWISFELDIASGRSRGGSYEGWGPD